MCSSKWAQSWSSFQKKKKTDAVKTVSIGGYKKSDPVYGVLIDTYIFVVFWRGEGNIEYEYTPKHTSLCPWWNITFGDHIQEQCFDGLYDVHNGFLTSHKRDAPLPACWSWIQESKLTSDGGFGGWGAQEIDFSQFLAWLIHRINYMGGNWLRANVQGYLVFWNPRHKWCQFTTIKQLNRVFTTGKWWWTRWF